MKYKLLGLLAVLMGATLLLSVSSLIVSSDSEGDINLIEDKLEYRSFKVLISEMNLDMAFSKRIKLSGYSEAIERSLEELYAIRNGQSMWFYADRPKPIFYEAFRQIDVSNEHGMTPSYYGLDKLKNIDSLFQRGINEGKLAEMDVEMTANYLLYNFHIQNGRLSGSQLGGFWHNDIKEANYIDDFLAIRTPEEMKQHMESVFPKHDRYTKLTSYLEVYRKIESQGGWPKIYFNENNVIEPDESHEAIPAIRKRLSITDPFYNSPSRNEQVQLSYALSELENDINHYDKTLQASVVRFQKRHGLEPDGRLGKETIAAMNISVNEKIKMLELNLERMRWLPREYGENYIEVNIPDYSLKVYQEDEKMMEMKVIVGTEFTSTPVFSDTLKYLVFSPTWTVPFSIKSKEMLPKLLEDSTYYTKLNYQFYKGWSTENEVDPSQIDWSQYSINNFPFNVVQQPGGSNSLGRVKFIMPNDLSIYLHDTPTNYLFDRYERAFSHGCIRVENPDLLAQYLLRDQKDWDTEGVKQAMFSDVPQKVYLEKDYHVQITYLTAFVDEKGLMNFREDIYGHDGKQSTELTRMYAAR